MKNANESVGVSHGRSSKLSFDSFTASSTASNPNNVVNLMTGFKATDDVSLNGSPTVSPTTAHRAVPCLSVQIHLDTFFALSQAPPAFAMRSPDKRPKIAIEIRYPIKKKGSKRQRPALRRRRS